MRHAVEAEGGRLLRILLLRIGAMPARAAGACRSTSRGRLLQARFSWLKDRRSLGRQGLGRQLALARRGQRCAVRQLGWTKTGALDFGRAGLPRIMSEHFSAIMMVGALRLPLTIEGMIEASTTLRP